MKKILFIVAALLVLSVFTVTGTTHDPIAAAPVPTPTPALGPACTPAMESSIANCPANTGCGDFADALLNQQKNRFAPAANPVAMTLDQVRGLSEPPFSTGDPRTGLATNENRVVVVEGFLLKAKREGKESCNCGITGPSNTDIHLVLVSQLPDMDDQDQIDQAELGSVTAEITPRVRRQGHPAWVVSHINDFEGEFVRLTGRLMLDTKHIPQEHRLPGELPNKRLKRATNWEVHPVTRFQFCPPTRTVAQCRAGHGWQDF